MKHLVRIKVVLAGLLQPMTLDAVPGVHQDAVQVEQDRIAVKLEYMVFVWHRSSPFSRPAGKIIQSIIQELGSVKRLFLAYEVSLSHF